MKRALQVLFFLIIIIFAFQKSVNASHLLGGEITWKCVPENGIQKYQFSVVVYRDCTGCDACLQATDELKVWNMVGILDPLLNVGLLNAPATDHQEIKLTRITVKDISPNCSFPAPGNPLDCGADEKGAVEKHVYISGLINFSGIAPPADANTPIRFTWEQNARNPSDNIVGGDMVLISNMYPFYPNGSTIAKPISECFDNAPDFTESPTSLLYTSGQDYIFNNNAIDLDLDNLYYGLDNPIVTGTGSLNPNIKQDPAEIWLNYDVFNAYNPFALAQNQYSFDNSTGEFAFKPLINGAYCSVIKVASYKCDQKVSEVFRDFQVVILVPNQQQNSNRFPTVYKPFNNATSNYSEVIAGNDILIPIVIRDSLPGAGSGLSPQDIELTVNGIAMGLENGDTTQGCPFPPCAILTQNKGNYTYAVGINPKPEPIQNVPGEVFGYGYNFPALYNDTVWLYWPTSCSNLDKADNCNGLESSLYNFVVSAKDNFCRVPAKTIRTFAINILPPNFYLSPPIRCITFDQFSKNVFLSWGISTGDTNTFLKYEIYRNEVLIQTINNRNVYSYTDFSPQASDTSEYYVRAVNLCGVNDPVFPVKPMKLDANFYRSNQARLQWNPIRTPKLSSVKGYTVYRSETINPYSWVAITDGDGDTTNNSAIDNFGLCNDTTYYKVESSDTIGCISMSTIDTIFHPTLTATFHFDTVCLGTPTTFYLDTLYGGVPPYNTVRWLGYEGFSAGNDDTVTYTYPTSGIKKFTFTVIDSKGCRIDIEDSVLVWQLPDVKLEHDSACPGAIINLTANVNPNTPAIVLYEWTGDNGFLNLTYDSLNLINPAKWIFFSNGSGGPGVGKFGVQLRVVDINGCETIIQDTIETGEPYVEILGDTSMCYSQEDTIKIKPFFLTEPFNTVQWYDDVTGSLIYQGGTEMPVTKLAGRRFVTLRVEVEDNKGCSGTGLKTFKLSPAVTFDPDSVCIGDAVDFQLNFAFGSDTNSFQYLWELDANTISTDRYPIHTYQTAGSKLIIVTIKDPINGCETIIRKDLTVRAPMDFDIGVVARCAGDPTDLFPVIYSSPTDTAWQWTVNEYPDVIPNNTLSFTTKNVTYSFPPGDGYYRIILRMNDSNTGCWTEQDTIIKLFNQPDIDFWVDSLNCQGKFSQFISKVVGNTGPYIYSWTGDDNLSDTVANPIHFYADGTLYYSVTLNVTNTAGCVVSKTKTVRVCDDNRTIVSVPEIFRPGGQDNAFLSVFTGNVDKFEIKVYNRWGIEVFKSTDPKFSWDGKDKGGDFIPPGAYVFIVNASGSGKKNLLVKGTIAVKN